MFWNKATVFSSKSLASFQLAKARLSKHGVKYWINCVGRNGLYFYMIEVAKKDKEEAEYHLKRP